ncbi:MAG: pilus assembly protein TadG-related protein [Aquabacterium commune]|uniref:pilus assembly protein TadG-related protein n=1 Tax=Aquabacterium commune TaxID=70586 RepID=UPI003BAE3DA1
MNRRIRFTPNTRTHQGGGISVLAALTLILALMFTGLALDTGRLWMAKRELQRSADMAALAAARYTGCGTTALQASQAAQNALSKNKLVGYTLTVQRGVAGVEATTRYNAFTPQDNELSNAAQVTVKQSVPSSIMAGGLLDDSATLMQATATAKGGPPAATFSIGSFASITQNQANFINALFRGILGNSSLNLGVAALTDLAGTSVNLAALQVAAGAATIEELLDRQVPISQLLQWLATSSPSATAASSLSQLGSVSLNSGLTVRLRDVLNVQVPASTATASVDINVLDLVQTSLLVGKGKGLINIGLNIAGVGGISLNLLNPPKIAVGPAGKYLNGAWCTATQSAQFSLKVGLDPFGLGAVNMALFLDLLSTSGHLASLNIAPGNNTGQLEVGSTLIGLRLRNNADTNLASVGFGLVQVGLNLPIGQATGATAPFTVISDASLPMTVQTSGVGSGTISGLIGQDTSLVIKVLGLGGDLFAPSVKLFVSPLLAQVGERLIEPLLQALGFDIGLVKVRLIDIDAAKPVLIL